MTARMGVGVASGGWLPSGAVYLILAIGRVPNLGLLLPSVIPLHLSHSVIPSSINNTSTVTTVVTRRCTAWKGLPTLS